MPTAAATHQQQWRLKQHSHKLKQPVVLPAGLGVLSPLADDLVLNLLFLLPAADLARLGLASKALYCFVHTTDLWKSLVIEVSKRMCNQPASWGSWDSGALCSCRLSLHGGGLHAS